MTFYNSATVQHIKHSNFFLFTCTGQYCISLFAFICSLMIPFRTLKEFMKNRMLIPLLEGKLTVPEGFNPDTFDYSILDDVLSVEGLGDILNDIPDEIRDSLVDIRTKRVDRVCGSV